MNVFIVIALVVLFLLQVFSLLHLRVLVHDTEAINAVLNIIADRELEIMEQKIVPKKSKRTMWDDPLPGS